LRANGDANEIETRPDPYAAFPPSPLRIDAAQTVLEVNRVNRFLPLPAFRRPYFVWRDETVAEQGCAVNLGADITGVPPTVFNPWLLSPWLNGMGRRAVQGTHPGFVPGSPPPGPATFVANSIGFVNGFWNSGVNLRLQQRSLPDPFTDGLVGNVALPLLADFWTFCDRSDLPEGNGYVALGTNGWQVSLTVQSSPQPNFRVVSSGRPAIAGSAPTCLSTGSGG